MSDLSMLLSPTVPSAIKLEHRLLLGSKEAVVGYQQCSAFSSRSEEDFQIPNAFRTECISPDHALAGQSSPV